MPEPTGELMDLADAHVEQLSAPPASSVGKALVLLGALTGDRVQMGVSDLARATGFSKSTTFRLLSLLVEGGLVDRVGTDYRIGQRILEMAGTVAPSPHSELRDIAMPHLLDLLAVTKETVHLAVSTGDRILYIEKIFGHNQVSSPSRVGGTLHASCSALGKAISAFSSEAVVRKVVSTIQPRTPYSIAAPSVLLDELRSVRQAGVAFDREEAQLGLTCVAAPVFDASGSQAIAAVSVSGPKNRFNPERFVPTIRETARRISCSAIDVSAAS